MKLSIKTVTANYKIYTLPSQDLPSSINRYPLKHLHTKLPLRLAHLCWHTLSVSHSSMSIKQQPNICSVPFYYWSPLHDPLISSWPSLHSQAKVPGLLTQILSDEQSLLPRLPLHSSISVTVTNCSTQACTGCRVSNCSNFVSILLCKNYRYVCLHTPSHDLSSSIKLYPSLQLQW